MSTWRYSALTTDGQKTRGNLDADSARQARQQLREQGLFPLQIETTEETIHQRSGIKVPLPQRALFTRQLATMVESGLPLDEVLQAIGLQTEHAKTAKVIRGLRDYILQGHSLSEALSLYPNSFDTLYRALVDAGEHAGNLSTVLLQLADHEERNQALRSKVKLAMLYPSVLTLVAVGVIVLLMVYVVPKVVEQFAHVGQSLPLLTRGLIAISDTLVNYGWIALLALALLVLTTRWWLSDPVRCCRYHQSLLHTPVIRSFIEAEQTFLFARTLGILSRSGLDLLHSLKIAAMSVTNLSVRAGLEQVTEQVREGNNLADALKANTHFSPILIYMIQSGEQSGELDEMLLKAATHQEMQFENKLAWLVGLFEPLIILVMGVVVLLIVLAILLPILQMNNLTGI